MRKFAPVLFSRPISQLRDQAVPDTVNGSVTALPLSSKTCTVRHVLFFPVWLFTGGEWGCSFAISVRAVATGMDSSFGQCLDHIGDISAERKRSNSPVITAVAKLAGFISFHRSSRYVEATCRCCIAAG